MEDEYGMADLRPYSVFPPPPPPFPSAHRSLTTDNLPYYMLNFAPAAANSACGGGFGVFEAEVGGDSGAGRWPRQETLTLLEIRSRLDSRFKEANQKGPLWDDVSRIMCEEFGYQRSGKKCREKFENLYKYYKKTKAGRQDGKHYRFFRQLEALYGDNQTNNNNNNNNNHLVAANFRPSNTNIDESVLPNKNDNNNQESYTSLMTTSNSSDFDTSDQDSDLEINTKGKKKMGKRGLKAKIKESIDSQMKKMMEKQEAWMEKMMRTIEENEQERILREEQWRRQDDERIERERKMWASEKAWIQARDAALMDAFGKMAGKGSRPPGIYSPPREEELMASFGDPRSGCHYLMKGGEELRKESSSIGMYHHQNDHESMSEQGTDNGSSPPDLINAMSEVGFRYFGGDHGYGRI